MAGTPLQIALVTVGGLKQAIDFPKLEKWQSKIIKIQHVSTVPHLPNGEGPGWCYPDSQIRKLVKPATGADFSVALINAPLAENYYMRRISKNVAVISIYEMAGIIAASGNTLENFILRNIYEMAVIFAANQKLFPDDAHTWAHDDIRGCLFDMNADKFDIVCSMHRPILCRHCETRVATKQIAPDFLATLSRELKRIEKPLFSRMQSWVKRHPIYSIALTAFFGLVVNILANVSTDALKDFFGSN